MGYEIIDSRTFIKIGDNAFIPLLLGGSNNCYDYFGRRERKFYILSNKNNIILTKEEIIGEANYNEQNANSQMFKYRDKWISRKDYKQFLTHGIENAHTITEWLNNGRGYFGKIKSKFNCLSANIVDYGVKDFKKMILFKTEIKNKENLFSFIDETKEYLKTHEHAYINIGLGSFTYVPDRIVYEAESKAFFGQAILKYKKKFIIRINECSVAYSSQPEEALIFDNYDQAKQAADELKNKRYIDAKIHSIDILNKAQKEKEQKHYIILNEKTRDFISKICSKCIKNTCFKEDAIKYDSKTCDKHIEMLNKYYNHCGHFIKVDINA